MNNLAFIASVVGSLAIPATVVTALVIFRRSLVDLISRVSTYEGLGQKVQFGQKLADAEVTVSDAVARVHPKEPAAPRSVNNQQEDAPQSSSQGKNSENADPFRLGLGTVAAANPSFTIIKAWEELSESLADLIRQLDPNAPDSRKFRYLRNPVFGIRLLGEEGKVDESFARAAQELYDLRNRVAHGRNNPTAGEAVAYAESARQLRFSAIALTGFHQALRDLAEDRGSEVSSSGSPVDQMSQEAVGASGSNTESTD